MQTHGMYNDTGRYLTYDTNSSYSKFLRYQTYLREFVDYMRVAYESYSKLIDKQIQYYKRVANNSLSRDLSYGVKIPKEYKLTTWMIEEDIPSIIPQILTEMVIGDEAPIPIGEYIDYYNHGLEHTKLLREIKKPFRLCFQNDINPMPQDIYRVIESYIPSE